MIKYSLLLIVSSFLFIGWHCGPPDDLYDPLEAVDYLGSYTFETNGLPDMQGWELINTLSTSYVSFSKDVPSAYSSYSVKMQSDTISNIIPGIRKIIVNLHPYTSKKYVLSYDSKGKGKISVLVKSFSESNYIVVDLNSIEWRHSNTVTFSGSTNTDSLTIQIQPISNDSITYLFIDNLYVEAQKR